jgi:hypothetical protein
MLAEKVGTLDLKNINKNNSGVTKKEARKARLADAPAGNSAGNQPQQGFVAIYKFFESRDSIQGDEPPYCCARRLDVIDITLRSFSSQRVSKAGRFLLNPTCWTIDILCSLYRALYQQA